METKYLLHCQTVQHNKVYLIFVMRQGAGHAVIAKWGRYKGSRTTLQMQQKFSGTFNNCCAVARRLMLKELAKGYENKTDAGHWPQIHKDLECHFRTACGEMSELDEMFEVVCNVLPSKIGNHFDVGTTYLAKREKQSAYMVIDKFGEQHSFFVVHYHQCFTKVRE